MKVRQLLTTVLLPSILLFSPQAFSDENSSVPEWLERFQYAIEVGSDKEPKYYIETVQPLYTGPGEDRTIFTQGRYQFVDDESTFSIGLGWREMFGEELMGGINSFFDFEDKHKHYRTGVGFELLGKRAEARVNTYIGLSPRRVINENTPNITYEEAVDGVDYEIGTPIPYLPWVKVFGGGHWYNYERSGNATGWSTRLEFKPSKYVTMDFRVVDDQKRDVDYFGTFAISIPFGDVGPEMLTEALKLEEVAYKDEDLRERRLDPVERSFDIEKERWVESGGLVVEAGRSN